MLCKLVLWCWQLFGNKQAPSRKISGFRFSEVHGIDTITIICVYLSWGKSSRDECDEWDVFTFENVPTIFERTHWSLTRANSSCWSGLRKLKPRSCFVDLLEFAEILFRWDPSLGHPNTRYSKHLNIGQVWFLMVDKFSWNRPSQ